MKKATIKTSSGKISNNNVPNSANFIKQANEFYTKLGMPNNNNALNSEEQAKRLYEQYYGNNENIQYGNTTGGFNSNYIYQ